MVRSIYSDANLTYNCGKMYLKGEFEGHTAYLSAGDFHLYGLPW